MERYVVKDSDLYDPVRHRQIVDQLYAQSYDLLAQVTSLKNHPLLTPATPPAAPATPAAAPAPALAPVVVAQGGGLSKLTIKELTSIIQALITGSTSNILPAQNALVPTIDVLPPANTSTPGQLERLSTDGIVYIFVGPPTNNWVSIGAAVPADMMTTDTAQTATGAAIKKWTANQMFGSATATPSRPVHVVGADGQVAVLPTIGAKDFLLAENNGNVGMMLISAAGAFGTLKFLKSGDAAALGSLQYDHNAGNLILKALAAAQFNTPVVQHLGVNGSLFKFTTYSESVTLSTIAATTDSTTNLIPGGCLVLGALALVTTAITGAGVTSVDIGDATVATRWGTNLNLPLHSGVFCLNQWQGSVNADNKGPVQFSAEKIRLTANGGIPTGGAVELVVFAIEFVMLTS